ncbi:hypothetical protein [Streptococcus oricebi]|uniref:Excreted peptide n=1 Tax=Streptococcus oricebi TaxID=1547447 RepID=A0ABS5B4Z0_9STRE|nr:hypothetical protein [Streptococcus oricebi]MBP2623903.1 hypothetical protein [Streptococcus oricebi]
MKKNILLAVIQALLVFIIIGSLTYFIKGHFFYKYLSLIFGLLAGALRFFTASLLDSFLPKNKKF